MTLRNAINNLSLEDKQQLLYALEQGLNQWIKLPNYKFIGINVKGLPQLKITEAFGSWAYGEYD